MRGLEAWEIETALTSSVVAVAAAANVATMGDVAVMAAVCKANRIPLIVDAAAQLPPKENLRRFTTLGADLVAFSGGKAIGGPQASGFLCGRRDLIMSAALQHLDLDIYEDMWSPPKSLIDKAKLKGTPQHGIGRSCKAGKEEIVGLLTALRLFVAEGDKARHQRWLTLLETIAGSLPVFKSAEIAIVNADDISAVPLLVASLTGKLDAAATAIKKLIAGKPAIHTDPSLRHENKIIVNPLCLRPEDAGIVAAGLKRVLK